MRGRSRADDSRRPITADRLLSRSGGSTVLALPPLWLEVTGLTRGDRVSLTLLRDEMIVRPVRRPNSTAGQLGQRGDAG
jgi:hypothetical protein